MSLSEQGKAILALLVDDINQGRYRPEGEKTFCGYREVHVRLGLQRKGPHWGNSLRTQGLVDLAEWIRQNKLPAITGLIVDQTSYRPGPGYYEVNGATAGDERWWRNQVRQAIAHDWSEWVNDYEPVSERDLADVSQSVLEGNQSEVTAMVRKRCERLKKRGREYYRDSDGYLRCKACKWHKTDSRISGDIVELHHARPISDAPATGRLLPLVAALQLLTPLCPRCHRIIHSRIGGGMFSFVELEKIVGGQ